MKKLLLILPFVLCFMISCQDKVAMAELEDFRAQAKLEEENIELVIKIFDAWGNGDFDTFKELSTPDYDFYYPSGSTTPLSLEETIEIGKMLQKAFPDISFKMEELFADGDRVIFRFIQRGTHKEEYMGIPATGNMFEFSGICINRVVNGKVVEQREEFDMLGMMQQLGMELQMKEGTE